MKGKRLNGKRKEYKYGELIFEGELINGIEIKGKEYLRKEMLFVFNKAIWRKTIKKYFINLKNNRRLYN